MKPVKSPWEQRCWRDGICRSVLGSKAVLFWFLTLMFGGVVAGIIYKEPNMLYFTRVKWVVLFPIGFATTSLAFAIAALLATARWLRFGRCLIRVNSMPGVIGGHFRGEVLLPETFPSETDVRLELVCETTSTTPGATHDSNDSISIERNWEHTLCVGVSAAYCHDGHCIIPFDFTIPYGLPDETDTRQQGKTRISTQWKLRVFAKLAGPDLDLTYRVPVFKTSESDPAITDQKNAAQSLAALLHDSGEQRRVRIENTDGKTTYICDARGIKVSLAAVPGIFGIVMLAFAVIIPCNVLPSLVKEVLKPAEGWYNLFRLFPLIMTLGTCFMMIVLGLFGLLMLFIALHGLVSRRTWIFNGKIYQHTRLLGIPWTRSCACASVTGVNTGDATSSGGKTWYDIVIEQNTASRFTKAPWLYLFSRITLATQVPTLREAEEVATRLRHELNLPPPV